MIKQLLEKLMEYHGDLTTGNICAKVMVQVEAQAKKINGLREALVPFVIEFQLNAVRYEKVKSKWFEQMPGEWPISLKVRMSDGRRAKAALRGVGE